MIRSRIVKGIAQTEIVRDIRLAVFSDEQGFTDEFDASDEHCWHIEVWFDNQPSAVGRMFESDVKGIYTIGRIAVLPQFRHQSLGSYVMTSLEDHARRCGAHGIILSAQCHAEGFYQKLGYISQGDVYMDQHCPHIEMFKSL